MNSLHAVSRIRISFDGCENEEAGGPAIATLGGREKLDK